MSGLALFVSHNRFTKIEINVSDSSYIIFFLLSFPYIRWCLSAYVTGCETFSPNMSMDSYIYYFMPIFKFFSSVILISIPIKLNFFPLCIISSPNFFNKSTTVYSFTLSSTYETLLSSIYQNSVNCSPFNILFSAHIPYRFSLNPFPSMYFCIYHTTGWHITCTHIVLLVISFSLPSLLFNT